MNIFSRSLIALSQFESTLAAPFPPVKAPMSASLPYRANADFLESKYIDWKKDPASVEPLWSSFFEGFELGMAKLASQPAK